jgi:pectate lyase
MPMRVTSRYRGFLIALMCAGATSGCGGGGGTAGGGESAPPTPVPVPSPPPPSPVPPPAPPPPPPTSPQPTGQDPAKLPDGRQRSFPTAQGFGAGAIGGRGGQVIAVTTLSDSGPGSLRACMMASGPRTCVFRVAGTITVQSQIKPTSGYLTVAGQTAPGGGIAIRNDPSNLTGSPIFLNAPHNIIRHIRIRPGPTSGAKQDTTDAITIDAGAHDTIIDHASLSWATDEPFNSTKASRNITLQWSLIYEGLSKSTHQQGEHAKGVFVEGSNLTLHHNFIGHATDRLPNAGVGARIDVINNVSYNMREKAHQYFSMLFQGAGVKREANIVGNWVSMGPSSLRGTPIFGADYQEEYSTFPGYAGFYLLGNIDGRRHSDALDERLFFEQSDWKYVVGNPFPLSMSLYTDAAQAVRDVTAFAGAWPRDVSDERVMGDFVACRGAIIDDPSQVGGWPALAAGQAYTDQDADGMADDWEAQRGVSDAASDNDGDGYTNLEEFLNELAGDQDSAGNLINRVGSGTTALPAVNCGITV